MIPQFPQFKKLELTDREEIEQYTKDFPPYSDYNFVSLYSYNTQEKIELSYLHKNLVIIFEDYITGNPFFSFLGTNKILETIDLLTQEARNKKILDHLLLIPEANFQKIRDIPGYIISEDPNNFDYIASLQKIRDLKGKDFHNKRGLVNYFKMKNPTARVQQLDLKNPTIQVQILTLFDLWAKRKKRLQEETQHEKIAISRLLQTASEFNLVAIGIYTTSLISWAIAEATYDKYSVFHFVKANNEYKGIFETTYNAIAYMLLKVGCEYMNYEQDLGIDGLRQSKQLWKPINFLKKYKIIKKR